MRKSFIYILLLSVLFLGFNLTSCNDDVSEVEHTITIDQLPDNSRTFLNRYFNGIEIEKIVEINTQDIIVYQVYLENGFEVVFNSRGEWDQVVAPSDSEVPYGIIPEPILQTLSERYYGYGILEINRDGENYHVQLSNNQGGASIDLTFNQSGEIISTSDTY